MTEPGAGLEGAPTPRLRDDLLSRGRILLMLGIFAVELSLFAAGLVVPVDSGTRQSIANQTSTMFQWINASNPIQVVVFIFSHNLSIALIDAVPALGIPWFAYSMYTTGLVAQALLAARNVPGFFGLFLLFFPYSLVELASYSVAVGSGVMIIVSAVRRRFMRELRAFVIELMVVAAFLLAAASMEEVTNLSPAIGLALWLPTGLGIAGLALLAARRKG
jgi:hypothetical protein